MRDGILILAEGELSGHHHAIRFGSSVPRFRDDALARDLKLAAKFGRARLYRDGEALISLLMAGILTTPSLCLGFLRVEKGAPPVTQDEHDAIELPPGEYYVGAKREITAGDAGKAQKVRDFQRIQKVRD